MWTGTQWVKPTLTIRAFGFPYAECTPGRDCSGFLGISLTPGGGLPTANTTYENDYPAFERLTGTTWSLPEVVSFSSEVPASGDSYYQYSSEQCPTTNMCLTLDQGDYSFRYTNPA
jgi:hypothetical protein